jgi:hypothetical protein
LCNNIQDFNSRLNLYLVIVLVNTAKCHFKQVWIRDFCLIHAMNIFWRVSIPHLSIDAEEEICLDFRVCSYHK